MNTTLLRQVTRKQGRKSRQILLRGRRPEGRWTRSTLNFWLGMLTTLLVLIAWSTNLIAKPLATAFGGSVALVGMVIAFISYRLHRRKGRIPVVATGVEQDFPGAVLAVLADGNQTNEAIIQSALHTPEQKAVVFLCLGERTSKRKPELFKLVEPHLHDAQAKKDLGRANYLARRGEDCMSISLSTSRT